MNSLVMEDTQARGYYIDSMGNTIFIGESRNSFDQGRGGSTFD